MKRQERFKAHMHEIRITAASVNQKVKKEERKGCIVMHCVWVSTQE